MTENQRLKIIRNSLGKTQTEFGKVFGLKQGSYADIERGKVRVSGDIKIALEKEFSINIEWLETGEGDMVMTGKLGERNAKYGKSEDNTILIGRVPAPGEETQMVPLGNNQFGLTVPLIPIRAYAGYMDNFGDPEYLETLDKHTVSVIGNFAGRYFAFVVKGDSMENWSSEEMARKSIPEGTIVTCREIQRHHWMNKLHLHRFQNYVIVTDDGIITKEITEHNTIEGYIICHSLNPKYKDRKIMLDDCKQILNVVTKTIPE